MARTAAGQAKLFPALDSRLYVGVRFVRNGWKPWFHNRMSSASGYGRGWTATLEPGGAAGCVPARETGSGDDGLWHGCTSGAGGRADARRLYHRQLRLALDLLSKRAGRAAGLIHVPRPGP